MKTATPNLTCLQTGFTLTHDYTGGALINRGPTGRLWLTQMPDRLQVVDEWSPAVFRFSTRPVQRMTGLMHEAIRILTFEQIPEKKNLVQWGGPAGTMGFDSDNSALLPSMDSDFRLGELVLNPGDFYDHPQYRLDALRRVVDCLKRLTSRGCQVWFEPTSKGDLLSLLMSGALHLWHVPQDLFEAQMLTFIEVVIDLCKTAIRQVSVGPAGAVSRSFIHGEPLFNPVSTGLGMTAAELFIVNGGKVNLGAQKFDLTSQNLANGVCYGDLLDVAKWLFAKYGLSVALTPRLFPVQQNRRVVDVIAQPFDPNAFANDFLSVEEMRIVYGIKCPKIA